LYLFNDVYARSNVCYNFLRHLGFQTFEMYKYHSRDAFFSGYSNSRAFSYLSAERHTPARKMSVGLRKFSELNTDERRVEYIQKWFQEY